MATINALPSTTSALIIVQAPPDRRPLYHDVVVVQQPLPSALNPGQILVRINAASLNRRELWIRLGQYPRIAFGSTLGADGAGKVVASADPDDPLLGKRVFLLPMRGWDGDSDAPESTFGILGGGSLPPIGTLAEYVVVEREHVILSPEHLDDVHIAAWPLAGLTAWRAAIVNAQVDAGKNVLVTGVGGGVALVAVQLCVAKGANVYVTSGSWEKVHGAVALGARGGVLYKDEDWPTQLMNLLSENAHKGSESLLDSVIDSAGGDIMSKVSKVLRPGGKVVIYGMTAASDVKFTMREVLKNQRLIGSTMGSRRDLVDATRFMAAHHIVPVVHHVLDGLGAAEEGFELLRRTERFGKIVIRVGQDASTQGKASL